nr:DUF3131 domain-containing protein [bacterium]
MQNQSLEAVSCAVRVSNMKKTGRHVRGLVRLASAWPEERLQQSGVEDLLQHADDIERHIHACIRAARRMPEPGREGMRLARELAGEIYHGANPLPTHGVRQAGLSILQVDALPDVVLECLLIALGRACLEARTTKSNLPQCLQAIRRWQVYRWDTWRLEACAAEERLMEQPLRARESIETRHATRAAIARLARRAHVPEGAVIDAAMGLRLEGGVTEAVLGHSAPLPAHLGLPRKTPEGRLAIWRLGLFLCMLASGVIAAFIWGWLALAVLPLAWAVYMMISWQIGARMRRCPLPMLDKKQLQAREGNPLCAITLVALLSKKERVQACLDQLEVLYQGQGKGHHYILLGDLPEADAIQTPQDEGVIACAREGIERLCRRYGRHFTLLIRSRVYHKPDDIWMGRERKRGALEEMIAWLGGEDIPWRAQVGENPGCAYVLTLDDGTRLEAGGANGLLATLLHPANRARVHDGRVVAGHGMLQPRVLILPGSVRTRYAQAYNPRPGIDPYAAGGPDFYMDTFGQATFTGKGLIDCAAYRRVLLGKLPHNAILSHDLLEGSLMRCGAENRVSVLEGAPACFASERKRQHRWMRGDWQLLPFIVGDLPVDGLGRLRMGDNLMRTLLPVAQFIMLVYTAFACRPIPAALALAPWIIEYMLALRPVFRGKIKKTAVQVYDTARRYTLWLAYLPCTVLDALDAMARALWRLFVSGQKRLQWVTAADQDAAAGGNRLQGLQLWPSGAAGLAIGLYAAVAMRPWTMLLALHFAAAFWLDGYVSKEMRPRGLAQDQRQILRRHAVAIWGFFAEQVNAQTRYLPPDNIQFPKGRVAMRTSPSNIGLYLISIVAAHIMQIIGQEEAAERTRHALDSLRQLEHQDGLPYNWYDLQAGAVLKPAFVSSVDAGNLAACMMAAQLYWQEKGDMDI